MLVRSVGLGHSFGSGEDMRYGVRFSRVGDEVMRRSRWGGMAVWFTALVNIHGSCNA